MVKIIDYKAGNGPSVLHAVKHLGHEAILVNHPGELIGATRIILPGVGSAGATMEALEETGLVRGLEEAVLRRKVLFLGICVGLQILFERSEEDSARCLGWLKGSVVKFDDSRLRVPQMGWNQVKFVKDEPFGADGGFFYFVNSYYAKPENPSDIWAVADYGGRFAAAVHRDNIYATQFHIEKSGEAGLALLRGFLEMEDGVC